MAEIEVGRGNSNADRIRRRRRLRELIAADPRQHPQYYLAILRREYGIGLDLEFVREEVKKVRRKLNLPTRFTTTPAHVAGITDALPPLPAPPTLPAPLGPPASPVPMQLEGVVPLAPTSVPGAGEEGQKEFWAIVEIFKDWAERYHPTEGSIYLVRIESNNEWKVAYRYLIEQVVDEEIDIT